MLRTVVKIEGMLCAMCEAHIRETIRKAIPGAEKLTASKGKQEASFLTETPVAAAALRAAIDATGYCCMGVESEPYEKKGWFGRK